MDNETQLNQVQLVGCELVLLNKENRYVNDWILMGSPNAFSEILLRAHLPETERKTFTVCNVRENLQGAAAERDGR